MPDRRLFIVLQFLPCAGQGHPSLFNQVVDEQYQQYDLFTDPAELEREHRMQEAILDIKEKFGKNAILKGIDLQAGATTMERNRQIGGHKSGT